MGVEGIILLIPEPDIQNKGNEKVEWIGKGIGKELEKKEKRRILRKVKEKSDGIKIKERSSLR